MVKDYGTNRVIHEVDLEIKNGEFVVFVGPSGCGKSTLLRMIAGLEEITGGNVHIDGKLVNHLAPKDRNIAMVFQDYALYPHMSVRENLAFGLKMRKTPKAEIDKKIKYVADMLRITEFLERRPKALSGGQRQRVAIGRAIVRNPGVFLFDEPLSNLDANLRTSMRIELAKLHRKLNNTSIYVTHDQVEAMTLADKIVIIKDGHIMQIGTPDEVYNTPGNRFVASFIGSPKMNFVEAEVVRDGGNFIFKAKGFEMRSAAAGLSSGVDVPPCLALGIRPEDVYVRGRVRDDVRPTSYFPVQVDVVENLGSEKFVVAEAGDARLIFKMRMDEPVKSGDRLELALDSEKLHFFDIATEGRLGR